MSVIAVFIALGGSGYAVVKINGKSIAKRSIAGNRLKTNAVTGTEVSNGSLEAADFTAGQLPAGPPGAPGADGAPGSAIAYARVKSDGTLDSANSKNVAGFHLGSSGGTDQPGFYCFDLSTGPAKNVVVSLGEFTIYGGSVIEMRALSGGSDASVIASSCPSGYRDAFVVVVRSFVGVGSYSFVNLALFASFN